MWGTLTSEVEVVINGKPRTISKLQAVIEWLAAAALKGNFKAAELFIKIAQWIGDEASQGANVEVELPQSDKAILERYFEKRSSGNAGAETKND